jgi:hypothetical protein
MKVIAIFALLSSFYGSSLSRRFSSDQDSSVNSWSEMSETSKDLPMDRVQMMADDDDVSDFSVVMSEVKGKLETATDQTMAHLNSVLMLKESSKVSEGLRSKIAELRETLVQDFEKDLTKVVKDFKSGRSTQGPLTDDETYAFSELLKNTWEETLTTDLEQFQQKSLPRWVSSVRNVWKGIEKKVMIKIDRFKKFVHKTTPRTSETCALPSSILVGTNAISAAAQRMEKSPMQRMDGSSAEIVGKIAILILSVMGVIVLAAGLPYLFFLFGIFETIKFIKKQIFGIQPE